MDRRIIGWLLAPGGSSAFALAAYVTWATWDYTVWGFGSFSLTGALAAAIGVVAIVTGLVLLEGRPRLLCAGTAVLGVAAVVLAIDLVARAGGASLLGEVEGWQGSDAGGTSSLAPAWALLVEGLVVIAASISCVRAFGPGSGRTTGEAPSAPAGADHAISG